MWLSASLSERRTTLLLSWVCLQVRKSFMEVGFRPSGGGEGDIAVYSAKLCDGMSEKTKSSLQPLFVFKW